jgi:hypothetical protein
MKLIMKDQARTTWPRSSDELDWIDYYDPKESVVVRLAVAIVITMAIATVYAVCSSPAFGSHIQVCETVGAVYDDLMSEDMAAYTAQHPGEYDEGDME